MDNGPAANANFARSLQASGDYISDMGEVSDLIKEDYDSCDGPLETEDLRATAPAISETMTRGHMKPPAYMIKASGLDDVRYLSFQRSCEL